METEELEGERQMKIKRNDYTSQEQFEKSGAKDEYNTVTVIRNDGGSYGKWMCIDFMTECKRPQTAVKRLFSVLTDDEIRGELNWRESDVLELIENGCFALYEAGEFSFGCEENQEGLWYVWLNVCTEFPKEEEPREEEPSLSTYPLTDLGEVLKALDEDKTVVVYANGSVSAPEVARYDSVADIPDSLKGEKVHHYAQDINFYHVYMEQMPTEYDANLVDVCSLSKEIRDSDPEALADMGCICDYDGSTYIEDAFCEIADSETSIYYSDIINYISEHVEEVSDTNNEMGWDNVGGDLYKAGQYTEYMAVDRWLWEHVADVLKVYALNYIRKAYGDKIDRETWLSIETNIEDSATDCEKLCSVEMLVDELMEA